MSANLDCLNLSTSAYLADTQHLSLAQHGAYLLILMTMRRARGWIKDDERVLSNICKLSPAKWRKIAPEIRALLIERDGKLTQKRLLSDVEKDSKTVSKNRENGRAGGIAKSLKSNSQGVANATVSPADRQNGEVHATSLASPTGEIQKGSEKRNSRGTRLPSDWQPSAKNREFGHALGLTDSQIDAMADEMRDWAGANANRQVARKADWGLTFKNWMRTGSQKMNGGRNGTHRNGGSTSGGFAANKAARLRRAFGDSADLGQEASARGMEEIH